MIPTLQQTFEPPLAISASGLIKKYKRSQALSGLDITVPEGAIYLLVGENGAGKTTLMRILLDIARPTAGRVEVFGHNPAADGPIVRAGVGYVPELAVMPYATQRVGAFLAHHANYFTTWDSDYAAELCRAFDLDLTMMCSQLSKGQVRRAQIVSAFAHRPQLLLLDEPADGLDPVARDRFFSVLADHVAATPTTVVISSHVVHETDLLADRIGVLRGGALDVQIDRERMDQYLRRYVVSSATDPADDIGLVLSRRNGGAESELVVWGDEQAVTGAFEDAGGSVRTVRSLSLPEATRALMSQKGGA